MYPIDERTEAIYNKPILFLKEETIMANEMIQRTFDDDVAPKILNANESHMACLMLLDTSRSMAGTPIEELNKGLNKFR